MGEDHIEYPAKCIICGATCELRVPFSTCPDCHDFIKKWEGIKNHYWEAVKGGSHEVEQKEKLVAELMVGNHLANEHLAQMLYLWHASFGKGCIVTELRHSYPAVQTWDQIDYQERIRWRYMAKHVAGLILRVRNGVQG